MASSAHLDLLALSRMSLRAVLWKSAYFVFVFLGVVSLACAADDPKYGTYYAYLDAPAETSAPAGKLSLRALPDRPAPDAGSAMFLVVLSNRTGNTVSLPSCTGYLFIVQEARDEQGQWRPIEPLPEGTCGNSYFQVQLMPGRAWTFLGIHHSGPLKTKFRFKLDGETPVYSNEFDGSIDPARFAVAKSEILTAADHPEIARQRLRKALE